jgi:hypothetical protein
MEATQKPPHEEALPPVVEKADSLEKKSCSRDIKLPQQWKI